MALAYYRNIIRSPSTQISDELLPTNINYTVNEEGENSEKTLKFLAMSRSSSISSPSSTNSNGYKNNLPFEETHSVINFKNGYNNFVHGGGASGSFLNFEQNDQSPNFSPKMSHEDEYPFWEDLNCVQSSNNSYGYINNTKESPQKEEVPLERKSSGTDEANKKFQAQEFASNKRPLTGKSTQALKKQCSESETNKQPKSKSTPSKDPQSVAAKNRRERISERLKVLQELVPNGTKVDLVTMLEKAIGYVKFLQLQVKVLAADEFWPAQGGRAPDLAQVKEALDAILSTQRDRSSSSK